MNSNDYLMKKYSSISTSFILNISSALYSGAKISFHEIRDALSSGQIMSKLWLIDELSSVYFSNPQLKPKNLKMLIVGGWIGTLAFLLFDQFKYKDAIEKIISLDIDPDCEYSADMINLGNLIQSWRFKAVTTDMYDVDYANPIFTVKGGAGEEVRMGFNGDYDVVINTSCEHIEDLPGWFEKIPVGKLVVLQSNNFFAHEQHVNCVNCEKEFAEQFPSLRILYTGSLPQHQYTRFMLIGIKE